MPLEGQRELYRQWEFGVVIWSPGNSETRQPCEYYLRLVNDKSGAFWVDRCDASGHLDAVVLLPAGVVPPEKPFSSRQRLGGWLQEHDGRWLLPDKVGEALGDAG